MNAAKALLQMLKNYDVTDVFGLPGETTLDLYRAWEDFPDIAYHMCRDERSSVFMADGYAKATGKVGICEGPSVGATHMIPGVTEAHAACIPMIVFTSDVSLDTTKKNMLTGFDQTAIFQGVTKDSFTVTKASEIPFVVRRAFRSATSGRPGPVHVRIPQDVYCGEVRDEDVFGQAQYATFPGVRSSAAKEDVAAAAEMLLRSSRPVMICGQGAVHSGAWEPVCALAQKLDMLVGSTINAKGIFPENHPLALGVVGARGGREWANACVTDADLILFVGSSTDSAGTNGWTMPRAESKVAMIQIDVSEHELGNNYNVLPLMGDARETLNAILGTMPASVDSEARKRWAANSEKARGEYEAKLDEFEKKLGEKITPFSVSRLLERTMPDDTFFAIDPGVSAVYPAAFMRLKAAGRRTAYNFAMGALGYAIPAAIGARVGVSKDRRVMSLVGDGSFGFTAGELETAARLNLDITFLVFDNATFGWIRGTEFVSRGCRLPEFFNRFTDFAQTDYVKVAEGFGLKGYRASSIGELASLLDDCAKTPGPKLIALPIAAEDEELPPVPGWFNYAKSAGLPNLYGCDCMS